MLRFVATSQFKRDRKQLRKQGKDMSVLDGVIQRILAKEPLPKQYREHRLKGQYKGRRECHLAPDWLLIYKISGDTAIFERTGSHSELFRE